MATMHDVLDAQWMYDNYKDGEKYFQQSFSVPGSFTVVLQDHITCTTDKEVNND